MRVPEHKGKGSYPHPWKIVRRQVLERDGYRCRLCGKYAEAVDHIVAVVDGGPMFELGNLQAICTVCNTRKENQRREWARRADRRPANRRQW